MNELFFKRLKEERKRLRMTQADAAAHAGVARETWSRYETGALSPGMEVLSALAMNGADANYLLTGKRDFSPPPALTAEEQTMLDYFREASKEVRRAALGALLGASAPAGQVGGAYSQHNVGDNAVQIGRGGSSKVTIKKGR